MNITFVKPGATKKNHGKNGIKGGRKKLGKYIEACIKQMKQEKQEKQVLSSKVIKQ